MTAHHTLQKLLDTVQHQQPRSWDKLAQWCDITRWPWACGLKGIVALSVGSVPLLALLAFLRDSQPFLVNAILIVLCLPPVGCFLAMERIERVSEIDAPQRKAIVRALQRLNEIGTEQDKAIVVKLAEHLKEGTCCGIHSRWWSKVECALEKRIDELSQTVAIAVEHTDIEEDLDALTAQQPIVNRLKL